MQMISEHSEMLELFDQKRNDSDLSQNLLFKIAPFWIFQK